MKVGVLTFHLGPNYGGFLQAYCLQQTIAELGHEVEIINYQNQGHHASEQFRPWVYRRPHRLWHDFRKLRAFKRATREFHLSSFTTDPRQVNWNAYDAIVVGSDIVWNCQDPRLGQDPVYFGRFPEPFKGRLIAYAPSIGSMPPLHTAPAWVAEGLRRFDFIRVRDEATRSFVQSQIGQDVPLVADPTWLVEEETPVATRSALALPKDFLLVYSLRLEGEAARAIQAFAKHRGLSTVAPGHFQSWADINLAAIDPFQWADLYRRASAAVAGTFHGALYCIRAGLPFAVAGHPAINAKLATPLALTGLSQCHIDDWTQLEAVLSAPFNHDRIRQIRRDHAQASLDYLKDALST